MKASRAVQITYDMATAKNGQEPEPYKASGLYLQRDLHGDGGLVLTADHCAAGKQGSYRVHLSDHSQHEAEVVWRSESDLADLAILRVGAMPDVQPIRVALLDRGSTQSRQCRCVCFPTWKQDASWLVYGSISPGGNQKARLSDGEAPYPPTISLTLNVDRTDMPVHCDDPRIFSARVVGASGGGVVATHQRDDVCVGVISLRNETSAVTTLHVAAFDSVSALPYAKRETFWSLLLREGIDGIKDVPVIGGQTLASELAEHIADVSRPQRPVMGYFDQTARPLPVDDPDRVGDRTKVAGPHKSRPPSAEATSGWYQLDLDAIGTNSRPRTFNENAPSYLLDARHEVVPFYDRTERKLLEDWLVDSVPRVSVQLLRGEGGKGKTRLAMQLAHSAADRGWSTLYAGERASTNSGYSLAPSSRSLLVIIDYAERWPIERLEQMILDRASDEHTQRLRVLLLARDGLAWWELINSNLDRQIDHFSDPIQLGEFTAQDVDAISAFKQATAAFQAALKIDLAELEPPRGLRSKQRSPLDLHMAALAAVLSHYNHEPSPPAAGLSDYLLKHERRYWSTLLGADLPVTETAAQVDRVSKMLLIGTLFGPLENPADARYLVQAANLADSDSSAQHLINQHSSLYPTSQVVGTVHEHLPPLYPDPLAEHFVSTCLRRTMDRILVGDLLRAAGHKGWTGLQRRALSFLATIMTTGDDAGDDAGEFRAFLNEVLPRRVYPNPKLGYRHSNSKGKTYYLHKTEVTLRGGKSQTIYFFARVPVNAQGQPADLPADRVVKENPRNGFLTVSKRK